MVVVCLMVLVLNCLLLIKIIITAQLVHSLSEQIVLVMVVVFKHT